MNAIHSGLLIPQMVLLFESPNSSQLESFFFFFLKYGHYYDYMDR